MNRNNRINRRNKQQGLTLIEALVWIILSILVIAGAAAGIAKAFGANETRTEADHITSIIVSTKTLRSSGGYGASGTDLVPALIATNAIPKTMTVVSGVPKNAWDGTVTVASTGPGFTITYPTVPQAACIELATKISRGGAVTTKIGTGTAIVGEVPTATATTQCASPSANSLAFTVTN
ncbi:MAG: hypothetical protein A2X76_01310 [Lysobacterales bacterium GWF1_69_6]|nr:MAG: hypothetical protein A2X76_01310 [Xanthomonadales bacterium GWF1_69_6]